MKRESRGLRASRRGFTMLELMVTMIAAGFILLSIVALLQNNRSFVRWHYTTLVWSSQSTAAMACLSRDARQAAKISASPDRLELSDDEGTSPIVYRLEHEGHPRHGKILVREQGAKREVLATHVAALRFEKQAKRLDVTVDFAATMGGYRAEASHGGTVALMRAEPAGDVP